MVSNYKSCVYYARKLCHQFKCSCDAARNQHNQDSEIMNIFFYRIHNMYIGGCCCLSPNSKCLTLVDKRIEANYKTIFYHKTRNRKKYYFQTNFSICEYACLCWRMCVFVYRVFQAKFASSVRLIEILYNYFSKSKSQFVFKF